MDTEEGKSRMNWETEIYIYTLLILHIKEITDENLLWNTGNCTQCSAVS